MALILAPEGPKRKLLAYLLLGSLVDGSDLILHMIVQGFSSATFVGVHAPCPPRITIFDGGGAKPRNPADGENPVV